MTTADFLDKHTQMPITKDLHLPVVMLKMGDEPEKRCSFVSEEGCGVYEDRPWACRMYPLGSAMPPARAGEEPEPVHFLFEDDFCKGHAETDRNGPSRAGRTTRSCEHQEELETGFREIVSHPWFIGGQRQLDPKRMEMFYTACYDLDTFRRFVFSTSFTERFELEEDLLEQLKTDDEALLRFAFRWLRFALFAEPTMKRDRQRDQRPRPEQPWRRNHEPYDCSTPDGRRGGNRRRDRGPRGGRGRPGSHPRRARARPSAGACCAATTTSPSSARPAAAWRSTPGAWSATRASRCSPAPP